MLFIDTGAFIGRYVGSDPHHDAAVEAWSEVNAKRPPIFTSSSVIDETATNLARIAGYDFAAGVTRGLLTDSRLRVLRPGKADEMAAAAVFAKHADQRVSFTDCTSFVLMKANGIRRAFSFDRHFEAAGFALFPVT